MSYFIIQQSEYSTRMIVHTVTQYGTQGGVVWYMGWGSMVHRVGWYGTQGGAVWYIGWGSMVGLFSCIQEFLKNNCMFWKCFHHYDTSFQLCTPTMPTVQGYLRWQDARGGVSRYMNTLYVLYQLVGCKGWGQQIYEYFICIILAGRMQGCVVSRYMNTLCIILAGRMQGCVVGRYMNNLYVLYQLVGCKGVVGRYMNNLYVLYQLVGCKGWGQQIYEYFISIILAGRMQGVGLVDI